MKVETHHIQIESSILIRRVLEGGHNLNRVLDEAMHNKKSWEPAQRAALQDLSYGTLRHLGKFQAILKYLLHNPLPDERVRYLLLVALYQLNHGKAAPHAVVDHAVRAAQTINPRVGGLVNAVLRNFLRHHDDLLEKAERKKEGKYSYQQWWIKALFDQYGERSEAILEAGNQHPPMTLRINRRLIMPDDYIELLRQQKMSAKLIWQDALQLEKPVPVEKLPGFLEGLVSVQDAGAQYAAHLLDVHDGMRILDACAAPGGKTAHILERAAVEMVALDKDANRLTRVKENLQRLHLSAQLMVGDAANASEWWDGRLFDRILADVPCSASGVVRRHPDIKWLRREADISSFAEQQLNILRALWQLLAQDGKLLYTTCSIFHQENGQVIKTFLERQPDALQLTISLPDGFGGQLLPNDQHDGFYYGLLQKTV